MYSAFDQIFLSAVSFLGAGLTAAFGLGGGTLVIAALGVTVAPSAIVALHTAILCPTHLTRAAELRQHIQWRLLPGYAVGTLLGTLTGISVWLFVPAELLLLAVAALLLQTLYKQYKPKSKSKSESKSESPETTPHKPRLLYDVFIGFCAATLGGLVSATGPMVMAYLRQSDIKEKHQIVATHSIAMAMQSTTRLVGLALLFPYADWLWLLVPIIIAGQAGTLLGLRLLNHIPEIWFRRSIDAVLLTVAMTLIYQALTTMITI